MTQTDVMKMTYCPKCSLEFGTLLHHLCQHDDCPVREAARMRNLAEQGMRQGRKMGASPRVWEYEGFDGTWVECRNADDACMWAEDGRRIREKMKMQSPAAEEPKPGDGQFRLIAADMLSALLNVRALISEAAQTGFNWKDGDWAERLFESQQVTSAAIAKAAALHPTQHPPHAGD